MSDRLTTQEIERFRTTGLFPRNTYTNAPDDNRILATFDGMTKDAERLVMVNAALVAACEAALELRAEASNEISEYEVGSLGSSMAHGRTCDAIEAKLRAALALARGEA